MEPEVHLVLDPVVFFREHAQGDKQPAREALLLVTQSRFGFELVRRFVDVVVVLLVPPVK